MIRFVLRRARNRFIAGLVGVGCLLAFLPEALDQRMWWSSAVFLAVPWLVLGRDAAREAEGWRDTLSRAPRAGWLVARAVSRTTCSSRCAIVFSRWRIAAARLSHARFKLLADSFAVLSVASRLARKLGGAARWFAARRASGRLRHVLLGWGSWARRLAVRAVGGGAQGRGGSGEPPMLAATSPEVVSKD